jgi:CBS domain containing-hemolysin-like protein
MTADKEKNMDLINGFLADKDYLLSSILLGNNITNISATSVATLLFVDIFTKLQIGEYGPLASTIFMTFLLLVFGAVLPKSIATKKPAAVAKAISKPLFMTLKILSPISKPLNKLLKHVTNKMNDGVDPTITRDEVKAMADMSLETGGIKEDTSIFIKEILNFSVSKVKDIMTPLVKMVTISVDANIDRIREGLDLGYSHFPVYEDQETNFIGILHVRNLLFDDSAEAINIGEHLSKIMYVYHTITIKDLLLLFQESSRQIALVNDEYGTVIGIVTLEDIIEAMAGDLYDEFDQQVTKIIALGNNEYVVNGEVKLSTLNKYLNSNFNSVDSTTIGGYALELMSGHLEQNYKVETEFFFLTTLLTQHNRIAQLRIKRKSAVNDVSED